MSGGLDGSAGAGRRMPQLDGLRAIGVVLMLADHWVGLESPVRVLFRWGGIGMQLFFVMSGFLLTGILLRLKRAVEAGAATRGYSLRQFYARRVLRIFPVYYGVLLVMVLMNWPHVREGIWWQVPFLTNAQIALGKQPAGVHLTMPFWTLAVEEQFYLVWPWVVLLVPGRWMVRAMMGAVAMSPVSCYVAGKLGFAGNFGIMMPACLQFLGVGALVAVTDYPEYSRGLSREWVERVFLWGSVPGLVGFGVLEGMGVRAGWFVSGQWMARGILAAMLFAWVISVAGRGFRGVAGWVLESWVLVQVGKMSYGVYAYHTAVGYWLGVALTRPWLLRMVGVSHGTARVVAEAFGLKLGVVLVVAWASWRWIEGPINEMKKRFPYPKGSGEIRNPKLEIRNKFETIGSKLVQGEVGVGG